jgi:arylsulfatase A-like enzyme
LRARSLPRIAALAAAALATGCGGGEPPRPPNVLWVVWDTARADRTSLYGYQRPTTPFLEEWARSARVFEDCLSSSSWTVPAHASMFTGLLPVEHGAQHEHEYLASELETLAERLQRAGYQTFAWTANPHLGDEENFLQGFETKLHPWDEPQIERAWEILASKLPPGAAELQRRADRGGEQRWLLKAAGELARESWSDWLDARDPGRPFLAFFNYMEAHRPLIPPRRFREALMPPREVERSYELEFPWSETWAYCFGLHEYSDEELAVLGGLYDAALLELDGLFAGLIGELERRGLDGETLVVLTADHGEHLGEHHLLDHQYSLSQVLLRVPLVLRYPPRVEPGRDRRPVMAMDLYPTLLELAGVDAPRAGVGHARSLLAPSERRARIGDYSRPFPRPLESMRKEHAGVDIGRFERGRYSLVEGSWKLVRQVGGGEALYDLASDPGETRDVSAEHPEILERMRKGLGSALRTAVPLAGGGARERSPELDALLRELGY